MRYVPCRVSFVTALGESSQWWSGDTRLCPDPTTVQSTCADVRYLAGLTQSFPGPGYPTGYSAADDTLIQTYNIKFESTEAGSDNGYLSMWGTNANSGKSEVLFVSLDSAGTVIPLKQADFLTTGDFSYTLRHYLKPDPTSRTPAFNFWVQTSQGQIYYFQPQYCTSGCQSAWIESTGGSATQFRIYKAGAGWLCADGTTNNACSTVTDTPPGWKANANVGSVIFAADSTITGISFNIGSYQRQAYSYFDWFETTVLNEGARVNFNAAA